MRSDKPITGTRDDPRGARRHPTSPSTTTRARDVVEEGKEVAQELSEEAMEIADNEMQDVTRQLQGIVCALDAASVELEDQDQRNISEQVDAVADSLDRFCERLSSGSLRGLADDARGWARENPTGFFGGSVALGFALSRLLKASTGDSSASSRPEEPSETAEPPYQGVDDGPSNPNQ